MSSIDSSMANDASINDNIHQAASEQDEKALAIAKARRQRKIRDTIKKYFMLLIGSIIYAAGLEIFLVPNNIIDGGVVGISIMADYLTNLPLGFYLIVLNIPFLYLGYKQIGKSFAISTIFSIICISVFSSLFNTIHQLT